MKFQAAYPRATVCMSVVAGIGCGIVTNYLLGMWAIGVLSLSLVIIGIASVDRKDGSGTEYMQDEDEKYKNR